MSTANVPATPGFLDRQRIIAGAGFSRWLIPPAALAIHLCIGMAYGFSVFWLPLSKAIGITKPVACAKDASLFFEMCIRDRDRANVRANQSNMAQNRADISTDRQDIAQDQANLRTERGDLRNDYAEQRAEMCIRDRRDGGVTLRRANNSIPNSCSIDQINPVDGGGFRV